LEVSKSDIAYANEQLGLRVHQCSVEDLTLDADR